METLRKYLESMFANLPNSPEVIRAKSELWQMMEDKYNELTDEGMSENEVIGRVISDFGNLDELADSLGIEKAMQTEMPWQGRVLEEQEVTQYMAACTRSSLFNGIGVMLCILSPITFMIAEIVLILTGSSEDRIYGIATAFFFGIIAIAVSIFVYDSVKMGAWKYLKKEQVCIDYATAEFLHHIREEERGKQAVLKTLGVLLCAFSFVPVAVMGAFEAKDDLLMVGTIIMFLLIAFGVLLLIISSGRDDCCKTLLRLNDPRTVSGNYVPSQKEVSYSNKTVEQIMSVYMPAVLCIYLIWSFLSFDWHITWIIWPVAAIIKHIINNIWGDKKGQEV